MIAENMSLDFQYPGVFLVLVLILIYFVVKWYYSYREDVLTKKEQIIFSIFKMIGLSLIAFLLFDPVLTIYSFKEENAQHLFLVDNSASMVLNDSLSPGIINKFIRENSDNDNFEIAVFGDSSYTYQDDSELKFTDCFSDLAEIVKKKKYKYGILKKDFRSINIISDGFINRGDDFRNYSFNTPVNCIYTGKVPHTKDLSILEIKYKDEITAKDENNFEVLVKYEGEKIPSEKFVLKVSQNGRLLKKVQSNIPASGSQKRLKFTLAGSKGDVRRLQFSISGVKNETNNFNNSKTVFQRVIDSRSKILILNGAPSFDLRFLSEFLRENDIAFDLSLNGNNLDLKKSNYDLLILLSFPSVNTKFTEEIKELWDKTTSKLVFINSDTDINKLASLGAGVDSLSRKDWRKGTLADYKEGQGSYVYMFDNEIISLENLPEIEFNPSLVIDKEKYFPLADVVYRQHSYTSVWQSNSVDNKVVLANIDSFWKLIFSVKGVDDDSNFSKFLLNLIDYLIIDSSGTRLTVKSIKNEYYAGDAIVFAGNVFDTNFKVLKQEKVKVKILENGAETYLEGDKGEYRGRVNITNPGIYSYTVVVEREDGVFLQKKGRFKILENDLENLRLGVNKALLSGISKKNKGRMVPLDSLDYLLQNLDLSPEIIEENRKIYPVRSMVYFILLILFLTIEWVYRKMKGLN